MAQLSPQSFLDFSLGRYALRSVSPVLTPMNSVSNCTNVNFDEIIGSAKVRPGTTRLGDTVAAGERPTGLAAFVQGGSTLGNELVTNGTFTGSASGWSLGSQWSYSSNHIVFAP